MEPLVTLLIGHRGSGKTTLLKELQQTLGAQYPSWEFIDLDAEIARQEQQEIHEVFARGEKKFRKIESEILTRQILSATQKTWIAVGAGCEGPFPENARTIWIRRNTDADGRVFLDRPRLNPLVSAFAEYRERFELRERRYRELAHETLVLPEGYEGGLEAFFLDQAEFNLPLELTLLPEHFKNWNRFWSKRRHWNLRHVEVRDDLLSDSQIESVWNSVPAKNVIYSCRKGTPPPRNAQMVDWALELGSPAFTPQIVSLHERRGSLGECFKKLESFPQQIQKLAVVIENFDELEEGHRWWSEAPEQRAFLPRSNHGRWRWYRLLYGPRMPLHFFREDEGSALDQPYLWESVFRKPFDGKFAAILGSPVRHSRTPLEHREFFPFPVVGVDLSEDEFSKSFSTLIALGLQAASVTAPLKKMAHSRLTHASEEARELSACNTLWVEGVNLHGHNTDVLALHALAAETKHFKKVWLWGGGGVKSAVQSAWPHLMEISARRGTTDTVSPDLLIWAVGRSREFQWPPSTCRPQLVLDLNYSSDSPGLEWAARNGIPYQSGLRMFKLQAEGQRAFWRRWESK